MPYFDHVLWRRVDKLAILPDKQWSKAWCRQATGWTTMNPPTCTSPLDILWHPKRHPLTTALLHVASILRLSHPLPPYDFWRGTWQSMCPVLGDVILVRATLVLFVWTFSHVVQGLQLAQMGIFTHWAVVLFYEDSDPATHTPSILIPEPFPTPILELRGCSQARFHSANHDS